MTTRLLGKGFLGVVTKNENRVESNPELSEDLGIRVGYSEPGVTQFGEGFHP